MEAVITNLSHISAAKNYTASTPVEDIGSHPLAVEISYIPLGDARKAKLERINQEIVSMANTMCDYCQRAREARLHSHNVDHHAEEMVEARNVLRQDFRRNTDNLCSTCPHQREAQGIVNRHHARQGLTVVHTPR